MSYQVISVKVDPVTKREAKHAADALGLSLSAVLKGFLRQFIKTKTVTFSAFDEIPNEYFKRTLEKARKNRKEGKGSPVFHSGEDAVKWLEEQGI